MITEFIRMNFVMELPKTHNFPKILEKSIGISLSDTHVFKMWLVKRICAPFGFAFAIFRVLHYVGFFPQKF